ncbi:MAG TPA: carboxypeptidase regulatory-like domain-containing protein [Candidatus Competibacteraceae bacterium]|nr:carboxypeptidase regulatory-like domain-containing protein [Candidatus Competibacteraceae bacterium]
MTAKYFASIATILALGGGLATADPLDPGGPLRIQEYQGVSYVTGGVGDEEREILGQMAREFNLKLMFATGQGLFLSDAQVQIRDRHGNLVLDTVTDGPLLYARLSPGTYQVTVSGFGQSFQRTVTVGSQGLTVQVFRWPMSTERPSG